jgi:hypothetical protein
MKQFEFKRGALGLGLISTAVALAACSTLHHSSAPILKAANGASLANCAALVDQLKLAHTKIESCSLVGSGVLKLSRLTR